MSIPYVDLTQQAREAQADGRANIQQGFNMATRAMEFQAAQKQRAQQFTLQTAELALRAQAQELDNQKTALNMQSVGYNLQRQKEQNSFLAEDLQQIQPWQSKFFNWMAAGDPSAPAPEPPVGLKSDVGLKMSGDMSAQALGNLPMAQNKMYVQQAYSKQMDMLNGYIKAITESSDKDALSFLQANHYGMNPKTGRIDPDLFNNIAERSRPFIQQDKARSDRSKEALTFAKQSPEMIKALVASGEITPEEGRNRLLYAERPDGIKKKQSISAIRKLTKDGILNDENTEDAFDVHFNGKAEPPTVVLKSFNAADAAIVGIKSAESIIDSFNKKYGTKDKPNAFGDFVGPVDSPKFSLTGKFSRLSTEEQKDARNAFAFFETVRQNYRNKLYGGALTPDENAEFDKVAGNSKRNDYQDMVHSFGETLKKAANRTVNNYKYSLDINEERKKEYAPEIFVGNQSQPAPSSPNAPSSSPVRVTSQSEYDAIKPGTPYMDDSGMLKIKGK